MLKRRRAPRTIARTSTGIARYHQLYTALAQSLADGAVIAGAALPSEPQLALRYGVSRNTVRRALLRLEREGRIVRRRGSGTFAETPLNGHQPRLRALALMADLFDPSRQTRIQALRCERRTTAEFLLSHDPEFGESALHALQLRSDSAGPYAVVSSYVPARLTNVDVKRLGDSPLLPLLDALGLDCATLKQRTSAAAADAALARHLGIQMGSPLLRLHCAYLDAQGQLVGFEEYHFSPRRCEIHTALERVAKSGAAYRWLVRDE